MIKREHNRVNVIISNLIESNNFLLVMNIQDFASGLLAGWAQLLVGQPLDFIKVRVQTSKLSVISISQITQDIYKTHGLKGFYRGASSLFFGSAFTIGSEFWLYEQSKRQLYKRLGNREGNFDPDKLRLWEVGLAGAFAGWILTFINCPIQFAKIQRQVSGTSHRSSLGFLVKQVLKKGIKSIYKGYWITSLREIYGSFIYYSTYQGIVRLCTEESRQQANSLIFITAGGTSGIAYHVMTYPVDTIKSNVQSGMSWKESVANSLTLSKMVGYKVALLWAVSVNSVGFLVYEHAQKNFKMFGGTHVLH